jgi:hypothetical protein
MPEARALAQKFFPDLKPGPLSGPPCSKKTLGISDGKSRPISLALI